VVPPQVILTDFLVDRVYPVVAEDDAEQVASLGSAWVGTHSRLGNGGVATYLGLRPRDDQSASLESPFETDYLTRLARGNWNAPKSSCLRAAT
jgi:hypothetical protein